MTVKTIVPCTITMSPSATTIPGSYFNVGGMLLID
jgi:hypothetical protein